MFAHHPTWLAHFPVLYTLAFLPSNAAVLQEDQRVLRGSAGGRSDQGAVAAAADQCAVQVSGEYKG